MDGGGDFDDDWTEQLVVEVADIVDSCGDCQRDPRGTGRGGMNAYCRRASGERSWRAGTGS